MAIQIVEELTMKPRGGIGGVGGFNKDESDKLEDMNYAEKLVLNKDFLNALATLKVATVDGNKIKGGTILLEKSDLMGYEGEINGAAHKVNQEFVALGIPFFATSYASDKAEKSTRTGTRGKKVGITYSYTVADKLRVYRISETFDLDKYAAADSKKVTEEGTNDYHEPTLGMRKRADKWLEENVDEYVDVLSKLGLEVTSS